MRSDRERKASAYLRIVAARSFIESPLQLPLSNDVRAAAIAASAWAADTPVTVATTDSSEGFSTSNVVPSPLTKAPLI